MIDDPQADGLPPLPQGVEPTRWKEEFLSEFAASRAAVERGESIVIDDYGLTHPSEFFAVASESYFQIPWDLREYHPKVYELLREFYITDLARAMDEP
jgi:Mlc titration factor MtfA (ptsG expression regulator)